jgi:hypothetical protein
VLLRVIFLIAPYKSLGVLGYAPEFCALPPTTSQAGLWVFKRTGGWLM